MPSPTIDPTMDALTTSSPPPTPPSTDATMSQPSASSPSPEAAATVAEEHQLSSHDNHDNSAPSSIVNDGDANMDPIDKEDEMAEEEDVKQNDNNTDVAMDDDDLESSAPILAVQSPSNDHLPSNDDSKNQATKEEEEEEEEEEETEEATPPPEEEDVIMECDDEEEEGTAEPEIMNNDNVKIINAPPHSSHHATPEQRRHNANHLDETLDNLQHSISDAILVFRKEETTAAEHSGSDVNNNAYLKLREAAVEAYHSLVEHGSSMDLSLVATDVNGDAAPMSKGRREKLEKIGRDLWKIIRANPDLFNDAISDDSISNQFDKTTSSSMEQKRHRAIAGGYIRTIAVRLIFLKYIDSQCSIGCPPSLHGDPTQEQQRLDGTKAVIPSPKELVFGLKVLSKGGRAILHHGKNARDSHDTLSLAISCFNILNGMVQSDGEAANEVKDVLDEAFEVHTALPSASALFESDQDAVDVSRKVDDDDDVFSTASTQADSVKVDWPTIVLKHLGGAKNFIDEHYDAALRDEGKSALKYTALQRHLPQLARLCLKLGSHFAEIGMNEHATDALQIDLITTNICLQGIKEEKERTKQKKEAHMFQNLEADLVLVSIESLYVLSAVFQTQQKKEDAIRCLDQVETYLTEQNERDEELYVDAMNSLGNGKDFVFSEETIEGPTGKDKADIKNRAQTALTKRRHIHSREKATLSSRRVKLHNDGNPSETDERCIDDQLRFMIELLPKKQEISLVEKNFEHDQILTITLQAIRSVYVRRRMKDDCNQHNSSPDPYGLIIDQLPKSHPVRSIVLLDKLSGVLSIAFEVRKKSIDSGSIDQDAIILAEEYLSSFKRDDPLTTDTTLFVDAKISKKMELVEEAKVQMSRAVSLYHSYNAYEMTSRWASFLKDLLESGKTSSEHSEDPILAEVLSVLAYSLSMSGNLAHGMKMAREAWNKQKCVNNLVTLFHCASRYDNADTLLEFDNALNELSTSDHEDILQHFPRLSNSCVENEADGGGELLLGVQERWLNLLLRSKKLTSSLEQRKESESPPDHSVLDLLCAYLQNFEHVISSLKDGQKTESMCEYLGHIIDGCIKLLQLCRDRKQVEKLSGRRKKKKASKETCEEGAEYDLIWNDATTQKLMGEQSQCLWVAETLWNIANQLLAGSVLENATYDSRGVAADLFAAAHDFTLMSEEEEGARLSKLDYDVKYDPEKFDVPSFNSSSKSKSNASDVSSEFSAQCLLLSAAVCVDYTSSQESRSDTKSLLRRSLHRIAQSQQEFKLNKMPSSVSKTIAILTMRCVLGIGEDSFAFQTCNDGLCAALLKLHHKDMYASDKDFPTLRQVKAMSDLAGVRNMVHTERSLVKLAIEMIQATQKCVVDLGGGCLLSLGDLQRKIIKSASSVDEAIRVFQEIDDVVKKAEKGNHEKGSSNLYSESEFSWFAIESHNLGTQLSMIGDDDKAKTFFTFALNLVKNANKETRCYEQQMFRSYTDSVKVL